MCLKESWFADCWKLLSVVLVLRMLGKGLQLKTTALLVFFQSYFQCGFWSSRLTADLQTVVSDRIARAFNRSGATRVVAFGIKPFNRVDSLLEFQVRYLTLLHFFSVKGSF